MCEESLPSIAEILTSTEVLSNHDAMTTVVRVGGRFAVKYGGRATRLEADNLSFLLTSSDVPVPQFYGSFEESETGRIFIVMEYIEGQTLEEILPSLTMLEKEDVFGQIQKAISTLRELSPPEYIGSIGYQGLKDGVFYTNPYDPAKAGPFASQTEMNEGILRRLAETAGPSYMRLLRTCVDEILRGHRTVFTHADLQPKNIMVYEKGNATDGHRVFGITIIDWEMSGWYPEYWEFCNATFWEDARPEWLDAVQNMMPTYVKEYLMLHKIRNILFY